MRFIYMVGLTFLLFSAVQTASAQQTIRFDAIAEVEVRADRTAHLIQVFDIERAAQNETTQNRLKGEVARRITQWEFSPAKLDGVAVDARTFVRVSMEALVNADDSFTVRITRASTGPRASHRVRPSYPKIAVKAGAEGIVIVLASVNEQGRVVSVDIERSDASPGSGTSKRLFEAGAVQAAKLWRYDTESVAGKGVAARIRVPITYCLAQGSSWCTERRRTQPNPAAEQDVVAIDPAVKLITDVQEQGI